MYGDGLSLFSKENLKSENMDHHINMKTTYKVKNIKQKIEAVIWRYRNLFVPLQPNSHYIYNKV